MFISLTWKDSWTECKMTTAEQTLRFPAAACSVYWWVSSVKQCLQPAIGHWQELVDSRYLCVDIRYVAVDTGGAGPRRMRPGNVRQQTRALGRRQVTTRIQSGSQQGRGKIFDSYRENIYWPIDNRQSCYYFHLVNNKLLPNNTFALGNVFKV